MPMIRAMRLLNAVEAGTTTGAQLQTLLAADPGRLAEWNVLLGMRGQTRRMAASSTAMAAVAASSTAMAAVAASSTAMAAVWASDTASDAVMTSATARLAVYGSDAALAALQAAPTQVQRQINIGGRTTTSTNSWSSPVNLVANGTKIIILRRWYSGVEGDYINWARGSVTNGAGHGPTAGSGGRTLYTGVAALGCVSGTYNSTGAAPTTNDATGNFVCAANGLRRNSASSGATQNVIYITV